MRNNIRQFDCELICLYKAGYSSTFISEFFNVSKIGVICRLRKLGVILHKRPKNQIVVGYSLKQHDKKIISLYKDGYSVNHIAKILSLPSGSVYNRLIINNIELRRKKGLRHSQRFPTVSLEFILNKIKCNKRDFDYFLGIFASDGNVYKNIVRIGGIADENVEFLQHWCSFLDNKVAIKRRLRSSKKSYYNEVVFKNIDIVNLLSNTYGIVPNKTFSVELPYITWDVIRGLFDGDGCLVKDKRSNSWKFEIVTASQKLAFQIDSFYKEYSLHSHVYKEKNLFKVSVLRRGDIRTIFSNLYKDCSYFLKRKYDKFLPAIQETE